VRRIVAAVVGLVLLLPATAAAQPEPRGAVVRLAGLDAPARIARDVDGVPHLRTVGERDLWFLQGWVHASDRLFQMDLTRRQASGTLAEVLGPAALPGDVELRTLGLRRSAARSYVALSREARAMLRAYADGVNAWVAEHELPEQYAAVGLTRFEPWTPLDSAAAAKLFAFSLSFDLDIAATLELQAYVEAGAEGGFDGAALYFADVFRVAPFTDAVTVPDALEPAPTPVPAAAVDPAVAQLGRRYAERVGGLPLLGPAVRGEEVGGSNEWVVGGALTDGGVPLLANDPHLALDSPATFYPLQLTGGRYDISGESFPGVPALAQGQNDRIAWGSTVNPLDVTDTYAEQVVADPRSLSGLSTVHEGRLEPVRPIPQVFRANDPASPAPDDVRVVPPGEGVPPVVLIVPRRNNGPIIELDAEAGTALSVQYTGFSGTREIDALLAFARAEDLDDFRAGLQLFDVGSQNFAYADVDGRIAYFTSAELPLREDLQAGTVDGLPPFFIRDGTGGNEWLPAARTYPGQAVPYEILPPDELPQVVDPPAGYFVNANNDPIGTTLDNDPLNQLRPGGGIYYLNRGYDTGFRAERIVQRIEAELAGDGTVSAGDMVSIQADVALLDAQVFVPALVAALERARASGDPALAALAADPGVAEAVGRLAAWDTTTPTGIAEGYDEADSAGVPAPPADAEVAASVAATLYAAWRSRFVASALDAPLARLGDLPVPDGQRSLSALRVLLANGGVGASGVDFFAVPGVADPADRQAVLLLRSMADALALLSGPEFAPAFGGSTDQDDYRWGRLHRLVLDSPLGEPFSIPPAGGAFPPPLADLPGIPTDGGSFVVDASNHDVRADSPEEFRFGSGPNRRYVGELAPDGIRAVSSLPGGASERLGSPFLVNLLPEWLSNDTYPVRRTRRDLIGATSSVTVFLPDR
jgi:penicillin amidase